MIGLDTNVLVRYIAQDDALQSQTATNVIEQLSERDPGFISVVAMTETAWVLERAYRLSTAEVAKAIRSRPTLSSSKASRRCSPQ